MFSGAFVLAGALTLPVTAVADDGDDYEAGELIVHLNAGYTIDEVNARWGTILLDEYEAGGLYLLYAEGVEEIESLAEQLSGDVAVDWAEANYVEETPEGVRMMVINAVGGTFAEYEDQAIAERIGLDLAHGVTRGEGVIVAVLDSGVDPTHEALAGRIAPGGFDFVADDPDPWEEANALDDDGDGLTDEGFGHGTMVAGIVGLVAPEARIVPIRVLDDEGRADAFRIVEAIAHALESGADVLNMSFGVPQEISAIGHLVDLCRTQGVVVVAGAGNQSREDPPYFPAVHESSFMITALDSLDCKADFADWNPRVLVSAPGTGVRSAYPGGEWGLGSGCSFATPFITGEVGLILSLWPELTPREVEERVEDAVQEIDDLEGNEPYDGELGSGRLYLPYAVQSQTTGAPDDARSTAAYGVFATPNPSEGSVRFVGRLDRASPVSLSVFDVAGRLLRSYPATGPVPAWDGRDARGRSVAAGVYHVVLQDGAGEHRVRVIVR
jgi:subtilisin family serine protease